MTTGLLLRFRKIFRDHIVEPEPKLSSGKKGKRGKRFDFFIKHDGECLWIEAKERFNGGGNKDYVKDGSLIEAINKFIEANECKELLFFSTYDEPIPKDIKEKIKKEAIERKILLEIKEKEIPLCNNKPLYLHLYIFEKP